MVPTQELGEQRELEHATQVDPQDRQRPFSRGSKRAPRSKSLPELITGQAIG